MNHYLSTSDRGLYRVSRGGCSSIRGVRLSMVLDGISKGLKDYSSQIEKKGIPLDLYNITPGVPCSWGLFRLRKRKGENRTVLIPR